MTSTRTSTEPCRLFIARRTLDAIRVVALRGEMDHAAKCALKEALAPSGEGPSYVVVDFTDLTLMDSSGINVVLAAQRVLGSGGGWLRIAGAQGVVRRVIELIGLGRVLRCYDSLEQAQADWGAEASSEVTQTVDP